MFPLSTSTLREGVLSLLVAHPEGVRPVECWDAVTPRPSYSAIHATLGRLCQEGLVVRVLRGRYTLAAGVRAALNRREPVTP